MGQSNPAVANWRRGCGAAAHILEGKRTAKQGSGPVDRRSGALRGSLRDFGTPRALPDPMIRIAITEAAHEAIARTLALGTVACEPQPNKNGERLIWIEERRLDKLAALHRKGESYPDVIDYPTMTESGRWTTLRTTKKVMRAAGIYSSGNG
jgi:hypothetical protein